MGAELLLKFNESFGGRHLAVAGLLVEETLLLFRCLCSFNSRSKASNCPRKLKLGEMADRRFFVNS